MATVLVKNIAESILLLPIRALTLSDSVNTVTLMQLEAESNIIIEPITRTDDEGKLRTIAYSVKAEIFVPHNKMEVPWISYVHAMTNKTISAVIALGSISTWPLLPSPIESSFITDAKNSSPTAQGGYIDMRNNANITVKIESPDKRQRFLLTITSTIRNLFNNKPLVDETTPSGYNNTLIRRTMSV